MKLVMGLLAVTLAVNCAAQEVPNNTCTAPTAIPNRQSSDVVVKNFNKRVTAYTACIKQYLDILEGMHKAATTQDKIDEIEAKHNAATTEYNALMDTIKKNSAPADDE